MFNYCVCVSHRHLIVVWRFLKMSQILGEEDFRPRPIDNSDEVSDERLQFP